MGILFPEPSLNLELFVACLQLYNRAVTTHSLLLEEGFRLCSGAVWKSRRINPRQLHLMKTTLYDAKLLLLLREKKHHGNFFLFNQWG